MKGAFVPHSFTSFAIIFVVALVVSLIMTPVARVIATKLGAIDYPSARRINTKPIPRMGGIAIIMGLGITLGGFYLGSKLGLWPPIFIETPKFTINYPLMGLSYVTIFAVGAIDDIVQLKPLPKLFGQIIAASIAVASGLVMGTIVNPFVVDSLINLGWFAYPVTVLYLVAYVNIINLIDGLDGLASGITFISSITMFVIAWLAGRFDAAAISMALAGSTLGFLKYNFNPASIFLGDSGSLLLGFVLGTVSLLTVTRFAGLTTMIVPLVIAGIPIMDTFSAIVRRKRAHVGVGHADKGHIHHRLMREGFNQKQAVLLMYGWTGLLCLGSIIMTQVSLWPRVFIFAVLMAASATFARRLHLFEPVLLHHYDEKTGADVLVSPGDPAFEEEKEAAEERHEERRERILNVVDPIHHHNGEDKD